MVAMWKFSSRGISNVCMHALEGGGIERNGGTSRSVRRLQDKVKKWREEVNSLEYNTAHPPGFGTPFKPQSYYRNHRLID